MIIALKRDGVVYMGYDTFASFDGVSHRMSAKENSKIMKKDNGAIVGAAGLIELNNALRSVDWLCIKDGVLEYDKLLVDLICKFKGQRKLVESAELIIAYKDKLFLFRGGVDLFELDDFVISSGTGEMLAFSYLQSSQETDPEKLIIGAFNYASERLTCVGNSLMLINTRDLEFKEAKKC
ncbi:MAG: hypothetical protein IJ400_05260 [Clostridia bacterium]|nr:hypothetical protein [Clostridia bacterium]